jgi:lipoprotein-releasing system permease protein
LARRNFFRGSIWNYASVFLVAISFLAFFGMYLHIFHANPGYRSQPGWLTGVLMAVILLVSFISLVVIFYLINRVRYHEIGVLRGIGAKRSFILAMLLFEILFIVLFGTLLAVLLALLLSALVPVEMGLLFRMPDGFPGVLAFAGTGLLAFASVLVVSVLAALFPGLVICGIEPYTAIRNRE